MNKRSYQPTSDQNDQTVLQGSDDSSQQSQIDTTIEVAPGEVSIRAPVPAGQVALVAIAGLAIVVLGAVAISAVRRR